MKLLLENWRKFINESKAEVSSELTEIAMNTMLAMSVFEDERESLSEAEVVPLSYLSSPSFEVIQKFSDSLYSGQRSGFLTYYSPEELTRMDLYILEDYNAGFAIKDGDDIVSVHNNSPLKRLGSKFLRKAKEVGGARLDHFDGFLSGLYRKHGFANVYRIYQWDENYKPAAWDYDPIDATNPSTSVYAESLNELTYEDPSALLNEPTEVSAEGGLKIKINPNLKYNSYRYGRPDVIMRKLT